MYWPERSSVKEQSTALENHVAGFWGILPENYPEEILIAGPHCGQRWAVSSVFSVLPVVSRFS